MASSGTSIEQRRWLVVGIALQNVLTPCLRDKIQHEMTPFFQHLVASLGIDKQTYPTHQKTFPPSTYKLNYESINNNAALHRDPRYYDYGIKDEVSLAKLFMKHFMAHFSAFDGSLDASAALAVLCSAPPFASTKLFAESVRSEVRNEWAHCDFSSWTEARYYTCFDLMMTLVRNLGFTLTNETKILEKLQLWRDQGLDICLGKPLDDVLLRVTRDEVQKLSESLADRGEKTDENMKQIVETLGIFKSEIDEAIVSLQERVSTLENTCEEIKTQQEQVNNVCKALEVKTSALHHDLELRRTNCGNLPLEDSKKILFDAPDRNKWFSGREKEIDMLEKWFHLEHNDEQLRMAAICGLGGCGKTTLAVHFAWKHKPEYEGGVFWFSMEDDNTFDSCINDMALRLGLTADTLDLILSKVLTFISQQQKPWLMVLDNVDQAQFSDKMRKVLFGRWKRQATGHLLITTRRERKDVCHSMDLDPSCCVEVFSFSNDEAKEFLVTRCGVDDDKGQEETLNELVCELGGLPLALEQAGARIRSLQCPMSKYLQEYKTERLQLLTEHQTNPSCEYESQSRLSVHTTWLLNFEHMNHSKYGDIATRFVQVAAFLDPDEIHEDLINSLLLSSDVPDEKKKESPLIINHIVEVLTKFSLFQRKSSGCLMLHRVVQDVIRSRMTSEEIRSTLCETVNMLLVAARSISDSESAGEVSVFPIIRHLLSLKRFIKSCSWKDDDCQLEFFRLFGENSLFSAITQILKRSNYSFESYRRLSALLDVDYDDFLGVAQDGTKTSPKSRSHPVTCPMSRTDPGGSAPIRNGVTIPGLARSLRRLRRSIANVWTSSRPQYSQNEMVNLLKFRKITVELP